MSPSSRRSSSFLQPLQRLGDRGPAERVGNDLRPHERRRTADGRGVGGQRHPVDEGVAEEGQAEGVPLAEVEEGVDRLHRRVVSRSLAERGGHAPGDIHRELDVGQRPLLLRRAVAQRPGEDGDRDSEQEGRDRLDEPEHRPPPPPTPPRRGRAATPPGRPAAASGSPTPTPGAERGGRGQQHPAGGELRPDEGSERSLRFIGPPPPAGAEIDRLRRQVAVRGEQRGHIHRRRRARAGAATLELRKQRSGFRVRAKGLHRSAPARPSRAPAASASTPTAPARAPPAPVATACPRRPLDQRPQSLGQRHRPVDRRPSATGGGRRTTR